MLSATLWNSYSAWKGLPPLWRQLDRFRTLAAEPAQEEMARHLLDTVRHFGQRSDALPEWREASRIDDPKELWRVWPSLPVLTKTDLRQRFPPERLRTRLGVRGRLSSTGGSTGEPTRFLHDSAMLRAAVAARVYCRLKMGWRPGMATVCVWGSERDIGLQRTLKNRVSSWLRNDWLVDGYHLTPGTVEAVLRLLRTRAPVAFFGFTSMLDYVARTVIEKQIEVPQGAVRTAWNGGEMLFDDQSARFQKAFGVPILNFYGGRELGPIAYQSDQHNPLQILRPFLFLEIVDDAGRPVAPPTPGRILLTSTTCRGTPFVRYEIGDIGSASAQTADESGIRALAQLQGRIAGLLTLPDGRVVNCIFWNHLFKEYEEIEQFQVVLRAEQGIQILLQGPRMSEDRQRTLRAVLGRFLGDVRFEIACTDRLSLGPQGKLDQVVRGS